jgi:hypothetical protein
MVEPSVKLVISCVSDEFGDYREDLRSNLTNPYVEVKIQTDFKGSGGPTLDMLAEYIAACDVVIHLVGDMSGPPPEPSSVDDLLNKQSNLRDGLASRNMERDALGNLTYTQWEAWLAIVLGKKLLIATPVAEASRGPEFAPTNASRALQAEHLRRLRAVDYHPQVLFTSRDNLVANILTSVVISSLMNYVHRQKQNQLNGLIAEYSPSGRIGKLRNKERSFWDAKDLRNQLSGYNRQIEAGDCHPLEMMNFILKVVNENPKQAKRISQITDFYMSVIDQANMGIIDDKSACSHFGKDIEGWQRTYLLLLEEFVPDSRGPIQPRLFAFAKKCGESLP